MPFLFFDRDQRLLSQDKLFHAVGGFLTFLVTNLFVNPWVALLFTVIAGAIFELGQWDVARTLFKEQFPVGIGFGVLDLAADLVGALFALVLLAPSQHPTLTIIPQPASAESMWTYVQKCSGLSPRPGHGLADLVWGTDSLLVYSRSHDLVGLWIPRDVWPDGPPPDTIVLDVWHAQVPRIVGHELLHHLIAHVDTTAVLRHPDTPFVYPCNLMPRRDANVPPAPKAP